MFQEQLGRFGMGVEDSLLERRGHAVLQDTTELQNGFRPRAR